MVYKTYIEKFTTIVSGSKINTGLSPISELVYGHNNVVSRALLYFDHSKIKSLLELKEMPSIEKMRHVLHVKNASSLDFTQIHQCETSAIQDTLRVRACSFDLVFFLIPKPWDRGKGFNYSKNFLNVDFYSNDVTDNSRLVSEEGCNWFNRSNGIKWDSEGIVSNDDLSKEYDKWACGDNTSIVIGRQHFDIGNESIELDITDTVNSFIDGSLENYGIGIAYSPLLEATETKYENYIGLLTDKTNTFFEPYVETRYDDFVSDDRDKFVLGKTNRLYLYCTIGDSLKNLDELPTVKITDGDDNVIFDDLEVTNQFNGVYYVEFKMDKALFEADTMFYDTWGNLKYNGDEIDDVEMDFTLKKQSNFFILGNSYNVNDVRYSVSINGIKVDERVKRGDVRKLKISAKQEYSTNAATSVDSMSIRLYVMDGLSEIDVVSWDNVNRTPFENYYLIDTSTLIPNRYHVDVKVKHGMEELISHDVLKFDIVNDITNKYV